MGWRHGQLLDTRSAGSAGAQSSPESAAAASESLDRSLSQSRPRLHYWQIFPIMMGWGRSYALYSGLLSTPPHPSLAESEFIQAAALAGRRPHSSGASGPVIRQEPLSVPGKKQPQAALRLGAYLHPYTTAAASAEAASVIAASRWGRIAPRSMRPHKAHVS